MFLFSSTLAEEDDLFGLSVEEDTDPRLFFANYTASLISVNSTILSYALVGIAIAGAVALVFYYLSTQGTGATAEGYGSQYQQRGFRSGREDDSTGYSGILTLLSVASDIYGRLDYDDIDCQKKIICEFMEKPEIFGSGAATVKSGVSMAANFLAPMGIPIISQLLDATKAAAKQDEESCKKKYEVCNDISLQESYHKSAEKVKEITKAEEEEEESVGCDSQTEECATPQDPEEEYEYYYDDEKR